MNLHLNLRGALAIFKNELMRAFRTVFGSILSPVLTTSLYFIVFGAAIGGRINQIEALRARGTTIILTTHYIEEAEEMADRVGVINKGRILLVDDKAAIMAKLGRTEARITLQQPLPELPSALGAMPVTLEEGGTVLHYRGGDGTGKGKEEVAALIKALVAHGIEFRAIDTAESSLEEIFVGLVESGRQEELA